MEVSYVCLGLSDDKAEDDDDDSDDEGGGIKSSAQEQPPSSDATETNGKTTPEGNKHVTKIDRNRQKKNHKKWQLTLFESA